ncbi:MAG: hypothetical protein IT539_03985 [Bradyrhizobiaceae bacterium]|nr:hypothetical protein [Bradyrhizobiaceae bacterium]
MRSVLRLQRSASRVDFLRVLLLIAVLLGFSGPAAAQGAFIQQVEGTVGEAPLLNTVQPPPQPGTPALGSHFVGSQSGSGEHGGNAARSFVFGNQNQVYVAQAGQGNKSNVGVFHGEENFVGVFQKGNNLSSNVGLINTRGLIVLVPQKPGAAPVNLWAIGLKNGGLMILR